MSDFSRDRVDGKDEDRLPWLEAVDEDDDGSGPGAGRLIAAVVAGLVAIGLIVGGVFWMRDRGNSGTSEEIIAAPAGDYKEKPADAGGMQVAGTGDVAYPASEGADVNSTIDLTALPETPVTEPAPAAPKVARVPVAPVKPVALPPSTVAKPKPADVAAVAPKAPPPKLATKPVEVAVAEKPKPKPVATPKPAPTPKPVATGSGGQIQLGAFSSEAKANAAWKSLSGRFSFLAGLSPAVTSVQSGGNTLYRLRAGGGDTSGACAKLKVAGESCAVVN